MISHDYYRAIDQGRRMQWITKKERLRKSGELPALQWADPPEFLEEYHARGHVHVPGAVEGLAVIVGGILIVVSLATTVVACLYGFALFVLSH